MMSFWIFAILILVPTVGLVLRPLLRKPQTLPEDASRSDISIYKAQLREIDHDLSLGRLTTEEADASRIEISRRLLAADNRNRETHRLNARSSTRGDALLSSIVIAACIALSLWIYGTLGQPGQRDQPLAQRQTEIQAALQDREAMINAMVEGLAARLQDSPDDVEGWIRLGQSYVVLGRLEAALDALTQALERAPDDVSLILATARIMRDLAGRQSTVRTVAMMQQVERLDPANLEALWFLGLDAIRAEKPDIAKVYFNRALATLPEESPEFEELGEKIYRLLPGFLYSGTNE